MRAELSLSLAWFPSCSWLCYSLRPNVSRDCATFKIVVVVAAAPVMAFAGAFSSQVMMWMIGAPVLLAVAAADVTALILLRSCYVRAAQPSDALILRALGLLAIVAGLLGVAVSALVVNWPLQGPRLRPEPFDWATLTNHWWQVVLWPALATAGARLWTRGPWRVAALVFGVLVCVLPLKLWWWRLMYEQGKIVLGA